MASSMSSLLSLLLLLALHSTYSIKHIPFGYQSNSAATPIQRHDGKIRDPSSYAGSIHYDPLHHALYLTGVTYADTFDGNDIFNLKHELNGWDIGLQKYSPKNGDCYYSVFKLPVDRQPYEFQPGNAMEGGVTLMHSRRFGSKTSAEACSAVDILPPKVNEKGLGGYMHGFEKEEGFNEFPPTSSPRPSSSTYYPTYFPSVTGRPTIVRGVVPEDMGDISAVNDVGDSTSVNPDGLIEDEYMTISNVASKVRIYHKANPRGILSMNEVQVFDTSGNNVALSKAATQSSDYRIGYSMYAASNAVDGDIHTFSHTSAVGDNEWWEVDLGEEVAIDRIRIVNRNCSNPNCLARISYATMDLINKNGKTVAKRNFGDTSSKAILSFSFTDTLGLSPSQSTTYSPTYFPSVTGKPTAGLLFPGNIVSSEEISVSRVAQKVRIQLPVSAGKGQLGIREVQIYDENSVNVAIGKPATQSSDWNENFMASNAVDADLNTASDTMTEASPWWEVDLGEMVTITGVTILNRWCREDNNEDVCLGRISYATLSLIDENGFAVATRNVGDTTGREIIDFDFSSVDVNIPSSNLSQTEPSYSPSYLPSKQPVITQAQTEPSYAPTYLPSKQPVAGTNTDSLYWSAKKVHIQLLGEEKGGPLSLVQVEVNAIAGSPSNFAFGKPTNQSSTVVGYPADNAVNEDLTDFTQTEADDLDAWWEVDLEAMQDIAEIVITNNKENLDSLSYSTVTLFDDQGNIVVVLDVGDVSEKETITLQPSDTNSDDELSPSMRRLANEKNGKGDSRELGLPFRPQVSLMETRSVRLLVAGHIESINHNDGYIIEDLEDGKYDQANVYGFAQQVDVRLPLGALEDSPNFINDLAIMNNPNANINGLTYSLEEERLGGFVTSGIDAKALLNDHLPVTLNTLYPVALVADSSSKQHYYVMMLAADSAELNEEDEVDSDLHHDTTVGSGANQQSWTDYDTFAVPGVIEPDDFFGKKGRPKFGSDYRVVLKKMTIDSVDPRCVEQARRGERRLQSDGCKLFTSIEKSLSSNSYNRDTIVMSQSWVQEFEPDLGEDTRPAGLIFAPSNDSNSTDLLVMGGSTSGNGVAFGTTQEASSGNEPRRFDLDGFITKIRADNGSFAGKDAFDAATNSFTNTHSLRISSLPNKHDVVASLCSDPLREWGTPTPQDHVYVVGSTEGLLPGLTAGVRDYGFVDQYPEETAVNSMEAFLMKVDLATMNPVWTVQVAGINLVSKLKGDAFGFGCAVTHDGTDIFLTGMVKDGGVVTDFSLDSLKRHNNAARGGTDIFVASYKTSDGTLNFLRQIGSSKDDTPARGNGGIAVDRIGNAIVVGNTRGSLMRKRDVAEYIFGQGGSEAASDVFIMSLERDTGEYAPISDDSVSPVIPVDNSGIKEGASSQGAAASTNMSASVASIFIFVVLVLVLVGSVMGSAFFLYKTRKIEQRKAREMHGNFNISPHGRTRSTWGLHGKPGGTVLNRLEDMNIMVEVRNSASGGWHGVYDDDAIQHVDFGQTRDGGQGDVIESSLFMEDNVQDLENIENSVHNTYVIGDEDEDEVTDEDLIQAYNEAMAIDIEPESEAVAALTQNFNMPNIKSDDHEIT